MLLFTNNKSAMSKRDFEKIRKKDSYAHYAQAIPSDLMCDGKRAYDRSDALRVSKFWRQRPYMCPICYKWHLTKQGKK